VSLCPGLEADLEHVVLRCLRKRPADRYASAGALADDLERWLRGERPDAAPRSDRPRRPRASLLAGLGVLLVAALAAVAFLGKRTGAADRTPKPDDSFRLDEQDALADLAGHGKVSLLGKDGLPRPRRWVYREGTPASETEAGKPGRLVLIEGTGLLEVLSKPPERFVLVAKLRHLRGAGLGRIGAYFGRRQERTAAGVEHTFATVTFADQGKQAYSYFPDGLSPQGPDGVRLPDLGSRVMLDLHRVRVAGGKVAASATQQGPSHFYRPVRGALHTLRLDVGPKGASVAWDGVKVWRGPWSALAVPVTFPSRANPLPRKQPLGPRGGVGLVVTDSTVEIVELSVMVPR
jgi:hypothetical protein